MKIFILISFLLISKLLFANENINEKKEIFIDLTDKSETKKKLNNELENSKKNENKIKENNTSDNSKSVKIGKLESPSLGSIGIETNLNQSFGLNLWSKMSAKTAINYLNFLPNKSSSLIYQKLLNNIYSTTSEPPKGNTKEITKFVKIKLFKLFQNGEVEPLLKIVEQLPDSKIWAKWKKWYIIYNLLDKEDEKACNKVLNSKKNYDDVFWEKANLVCLILQGNLFDANFIFDVLNSQNLLDNDFKKLVDIIVNDKLTKDLKFDNKVLEPLNLVLLDILKYPINTKMIENVGNEYTNVLLKLIYLDTDARVFLVNKMSNFKTIDPDIMTKAFQAVKDKSYTEEKLLEMLINERSGASRAQVFLHCLKIKDNLTKVNFILKVLEIEEKNKNLNSSINLYLPILTNLKKKTLSKSQLEIIDFIQVLYFPEKFPQNKLSQIIQLNTDVAWDYELINQHKAWRVTKYLETLGMKAPKIDWANNFYGSSTKNFNSNSRWSSDNTLKEFLLEKSIQYNIDNKDKFMTLLNIGVLIGNKDLKSLNLGSFFVIDKALFSLGLNEQRSKIRKEIFFHKFFNFNVYNKND